MVTERRDALDCSALSFRSRDPCRFPTIRHISCEFRSRNFTDININELHPTPVLRLPFVSSGHGSVLSCFICFPGRFPCTEKQRPRPNPLVLLHEPKTRRGENLGAFLSKRFAFSQIFFWKVKFLFRALLQTSVGSVQTIAIIFILWLDAHRFKNEHRTLPIV